MNKLRIGSIISLAGLAVLLLGPLTAQARIDNQPSTTITSSTIAASIPNPLIVGSTTIGTSVTSTAFFANSTGTPSYIANFNSIYYASPTSTGDYGAYLGNLCTASLAGVGNSSGSLIMIPQENVTFSSPIVMNGRCMYVGVGGGGTVWNWAGATGTILATMQFTPTPWNRTGGGFKGISFYNLGLAVTSTNPSIAILMSGGTTSTLGGAHSFIQENYFFGWGSTIVAASGTYNTQIENNTFERNAQSFHALTASNSGESHVLAYNWFADSSSDDLNCVQFDSSAIEIAFLNGNTYDNCQFHTGDNNQIFINGFESENGDGKGGYDEILQDSGVAGNLVIVGAQFHNNGTSTSTTWSSLFNMNGNYSITGVTVSKQSTASSTPLLIKNNGSVTDNGQICGPVVNQNGNSYASFGSFPWSNLPTGTINLMPCVSMYHNSYPFGWTQSSVNTYTLYADGGVAETIAIPPGGSNANGYGHNFGGNATPTSTIDNGGTYGYSSSQFTSTTTIPALIGSPFPKNTYTFTGTSTSIFLPLASSTQNRGLTITNAGSGNLLIIATSTDHIYATSSITVFTLGVGTQLRILNENGSTWYQQ